MLESLVLQEIRALNEYHNWGYSLSFWRTANAIEVDIICYGKSGFHAIEIKRSQTIATRQLRGLKKFHEDYPEATRWLVYGGKDQMEIDGITIIPVGMFLQNIDHIMQRGGGNPL